MELTSVVMTRKSETANLLLPLSPTPCKTSSATSSRLASTPHPRASSGSSGKSKTYPSPARIKN